MFFAALMSRSCRARQAGHVQCLVERLSSASRYPHELHVLELGYQRSTGITRRPARSALYWTMRRKVPHPQSEMALASDRFRTMFVAKSVIPRSTPTAAPVAGSGPGPGGPVMDKLTRGRGERRFLPGLKAGVSTPRT